MASKTTNYNLHKIDLADSPPDITVLNQNADIIDAELKKAENHRGGKSNPHGVTASQAGALPKKGGTLDGNLAICPNSGTVSPRIVLIAKDGEGTNSFKNASTIAKNATSEDDYGTQVCDYTKDGTKSVKLIATAKNAPENVDEDKSSVVSVMVTDPQGVSKSYKLFGEHNKHLVLTGDDVVDNLESTSPKLPLSANQGRLLSENIGKQISSIFSNNAGAHNAVYRGKYLGTVVTDTQYSAISDGTFDDLYIGDYWTINGVNWRIASFDYYLNSGDTYCTTHHIVIVPDTVLYTYKMNTSKSTSGGYVGSDLYKNGLTQAKTIINNAFSGHVLSHREFFINAVSSGKPSAGAWYDSQVDLMSEEMVHGCAIIRSAHDGTSTVISNYRTSKSQLPLFAHEPSRANISADWWLRDPVSSERVTTVAEEGSASQEYANAMNIGVRPSFCIY